MAVVNQRLHHEIDQIRGQQAGLQREETELRQKLAELSAQLLGRGQEENVRPPGPDVIALALPGPGQEYRRAERAVVSPATSAGTASALHGAQRLSQL